MIYLSSFKLSDRNIKNPNIYPYNVFRRKPFIIAMHFPFMLGTLDAKIYNIDKEDYSICEWYELENVRYFYDFFKKHEKEFEE